MLSLKPIGDRVVIKPANDGESTFAGGELVLPETAKKKPQRGVISAVGPGRINGGGVLIPMNVQVGQHALYAKYAGTEVKIDGETLLLLRESDILAIIEA
jgi:chaperonin GroES